MNNRWLFSSFAVSSVIHLTLIPVAALVIKNRPAKSDTVPIELVEIPRVEEVKFNPAPPPPSAPRAKPQTIAAPKLLSGPEITETKALSPPGNTTEEVKEPEPIEEPVPRLASLPTDSGSVLGGWNPGTKAREAEGAVAGAGNLFGKGDVSVVGGSGVEGGGGGTGSSGLGRGDKGDGKGGGGVGSGEALAGIARPLGGYQVKPRYPELARRAGAQGVTLLKVRVLETGRVGEILVEQSAGRRDLDLSAVEAVKKWLFEPARRGKNPVPVWVFLPVKFELGS
jgi:TonB family protein